MKDYSQNLVLEWYQKGEEIAGEEKFSLEENEVYKIFKSDNIDFREGLYPIKEQHIYLLQPFINHKINTECYTHYVIIRSS